MPTHDVPSTAHPAVQTPRVYASVYAAPIDVATMAGARLGGMYHLLLTICNSGLSPKITIVACCKHCACVTLYDETARKVVQRPASYLGRRSIVTKEKLDLIEIDSRETELSEQDHAKSEPSEQIPAGQISQCPYNQTSKSQSLVN